MNRATLKKWGPFLVLLAFFSFWLVWKKPAHQEVHSTTHLAMGTLVTVSTWGVATSVEEKAVAQIFARIDQVEELASRQKTGTPVYQVNHATPGTPVVVPEELATILAAGLEMHTVSNGAFDPGLGFLSDLWGFGHGVPDVGKIPAATELAAWLHERKKNTDYGIKLVKEPGGAMTVQVDGYPFTLDLGAIAKGYALDQAMETMKQSGVQNGLIIGGGDMIITGSKGGQPWRIGIQHPRDHDKIMASSEIKGDLAMATSGDYERFFMVDGEREHHILDPQTAKPSRSGLISVSIQTQKAMTADMLSTAVFVMGMEKGRKWIEKMAGVEGMLVTENGERWKSPGFQGQWLEGP
ncbi:MAG: FAD:protein FMN transferase [Nitrospirae bacterium]|nr:FAD:protein FMN transferase [Magnetococcales bacterium]HAT50191.1 hypothetical protein [Alphaproteobacteria bacterium]